MKKCFLPIYLVFSVIIFFAYCKKDSETAPPAATAPNFSPLTAGTNWTYKYTEGTVSSTFKLTVTNRDTVANNKTYKVLTSSDGAANNYLAKVGSDYYRFASFPSIGVSSFEELYLKDNAAVNDTWNGNATFKYSGLTLTANLTYTIKEKGVSRAVMGKAFSNVTRVRLDISIFGVGIIGGGDFYYQEGVGLIEDAILVTAPGAPAYSSKQEIISYEIK